MTLKERLEAAKARAETARAAAMAIIEGAVNEDGSPRDLNEEENAQAATQAEAMESANAEITSVERLIAAEVANAPRADARPAYGRNEASPGESRNMAADDMIGVAMMAAAIRFANSAIDSSTVPDLLVANGYEAVANQFFAADTTNQTTTDNLGGFTVPDVLLTEMIDSLREESVFLAMNPRQVDMPRGNARKTGAFGTTAGYGQEGANTLVTAAEFREVDLVAKRLVSTITPSIQLLNWSLSNVRNAITVDLRGAMVETMDINAIRGVAGGDNPVGLRFITGVPVVAESGATATYPDVDAQLEGMLTRKRNAKIKHNANTHWIMTPRVLGFLRALTNGQGVKAYPEIQGSEDNLMLKGYKVHISSLFPDNLGAGTNESEIFLVQANHVLDGKAMDMSFKASDTTAIVHSDATVHSMFQQGRVAIQAEMWHDLDIEHAAAVQVMNEVTWGA